MRKIRIHVSSPSDVQEESQALVGLVADLQRETAEKRGLVLDLVRWEESAVPALGRPQEAINRQIPATDIFIGVLWARFGSPTVETNSGTEKELRRALDSWQLLGCPHVLLYFCNRPIDPEQLDPDQLTRVQKFRKSIAEHQLYATYRSVEEFRSLVRRDLAKLVQELDSREERTERPPRLFYSYAHEDAGLREELAKHLRVLERKHIIESLVRQYDRPRRGMV